MHNFCLGCNSRGALLARLLETKEAPSFLAARKAKSVINVCLCCWLTLCKIWISNRKVKKKQKQTKERIWLNYAQAVPPEKQSSPCLSGRSHYISLLQRCNVENMLFSKLPELQHTKHLSLRPNPQMAFGHFSAHPIQVPEKTFIISCKWIIKKTAGHISSLIIFQIKVWWIGGLHNELF